MLLQVRSDVGTEAEAGPGNVSFYNFDLVAQEIGKTGAVAVKQRIKYGRFFHHLLEPGLGGIRFLPADQQINVLHFGQIEKGIHEPDFADESGHANQHDLFSGEGSTHRKTWGLPVPVKMDDGANGYHNPSLGGYDCGSERVDRNIEMSSQSLGRTTPVWHVFAQRGERATRTDHRIQQSPGSNAVTKFEAIGHDVLDAKMLRQRTHDLFESLADQHDIGPALCQFPHLPHACLL